MNDFFKSPHLIWWILVPVALFINFMTWYNPHWFGQFGMSGRFLELLGARFPSFFIATNLFALIAHFGESLYSLKLCNLLHISRNNTLKWMLQTFILGYPSLRILLNQNTPNLKRLYVVEFNTHLCGPVPAESSTALTHLIDSGRRFLDTILFLFRRP